jgi:molybdopterin molybdotransferase
MERLIGERVQPVADSETVTLADARGRVLAAEVIAPLDLPPFDNSAVDGYAVRHRDLGAASEIKLTITGRLTAGSAATSPLGAGEAAQCRHRLYAGGRARRGRYRHRASGIETRRQPAACR